jgi:hypothetical protein
MTSPNWFANGTDPDQRWQARLAVTARAMPYPPTPDLALAVYKAVRASPLARTARSRRPALARNPRRPGWAYGLALILLLVALLAVPGVRAGLVRFLQLGAVRIQLVPPESPAPAPTGAAALASPEPLASVLDIAGETTLAEARERLTFRIPLPAYPADLGQPDQVFLQTQGDPEEGAALVLVWLAPDDPNRVRLALYILNSPFVAEKLLHEVVKQQPPEVETTDVHGRIALWTTGPYVLMTQLGWLVEFRLVEGHVLIWADGPLTYRLETDLSLDEAVRIAESLR